MSPVIIKVPDRNSTILATKSVADRTVVAHGRSMQTVLRKAVKSGAKEPVLMFIPREDTRYVF